MCVCVCVPLCHLEDRFKIDLSTLETVGADSLKSGFMVVELVTREGIVKTLAF